MKTKYIGLEGYNEIEQVPSKKKGAKKLNTAQKTVRFIKRAVSLGKKKLLNKKKTAAALKSKRIKQASVIEKQYLQSRTAAVTGSSAMESLRYLKNKPVGKTYQHSAPKEYRKHNFVKKRAVLAVAACLTAIMMSCVTVASALDASQSEPVAAPEPKAPVAAAATVDEAVKFDLDTPDIYVNTGVSSLYIDGELIGSTTETAELDAALEQMLLDARAAYDDTTTTEFINVEVEKRSFDASADMSAAELLEKADGRFSIKLETDWSYEIELDYETDITYDEDEDSDYEKVITEGEKGAEEISTRLTYIDGVFVDAEILDFKLVKEPVTEEVVRGCKQGVKESESEETSGSGDFIWPFPHTHSISSLFEWRWGRMHQGIDIAGGGDYGQPVVAADSGKVTWAGNDGGGYGNYVMIDHGNGYMTVYAHGCDVACSTGDYVNQGDTIMYCGSTGNSTGPHVHFEIRVDGTQVDPLGYVS